MLLFVIEITEDILP